MKTVIINVNLEYHVETDSEEEAREYVMNVELPKEYVEDSFEMVKVMEFDGRRCHLCGELEINKWCENETCEEYTKHLTN